VLHWRSQLAPSDEPSQGINCRPGERRDPYRLCFSRERRWLRTSPTITDGVMFPAFAGTDTKFPSTPSRSHGHVHRAQLGGAAEIRQSSDEAGATTFCAELSHVFTSPSAGCAGGDQIIDQDGRLRRDATRIGMPLHFIEAIFPGSNGSAPWCAAALPFFRLLHDAGET